MSNPLEQNRRRLDEEVARLKIRALRQQQQNVVYGGSNPTATLTRVGDTFRHLAALILRGVVLIATGLGGLLAVKWLLTQFWVWWKWI